jgi:hypothetical protein
MGDGRSAGDGTGVRGGSFFSSTDGDADGSKGDGASVGARKRGTGVHGGSSPLWMVAQATVVAGVHFCLSLLWNWPFVFVSGSRMGGRRGGSGFYILRPLVPVGNKAQD